MKTPQNADFGNFWVILLVPVSLQAIVISLKTFFNPDAVLYSKTKLRIIAATQIKYRTMYHTIYHLARVGARAHRSLARRSEHWRAGAIIRSPPIVDFLAYFTTEFIMGEIE